MSYLALYLIMHSKSTFRRANSLRLNCQSLCWTPSRSPMRTMVLMPSFTTGETLFFPTFWYQCRPDDTGKSISTLTLACLCTSSLTLLVSIIQGIVRTRLVVSRARLTHGPMLVTIFQWPHHHIDNSSRSYKGGDVCDCNPSVAILCLCMMDWGRFGSIDSSLQSFQSFLGINWLP